jgi:luciferase-type oxidoreductase
VSSSGTLSGLDPLPKPALGGVPMVVAGHAGQSLEWIAQNADGWITYPRPLSLQAKTAAAWHAAAAGAGRARAGALAQSLYIDLGSDPRESPRPIHLGWALGREPLVELLGELAQLGMGHVVLNLKHSRRPATEVLEELGAEVLPRFRHDRRSAA